MKQVSCAKRPIEDFLDGKLDKETRADFETHLSECEVCQQQITRSAADPEMWTEVVELLGEDSGDIDQTCASSTNDGTKQVLSVLDSLAPSDDPSMLGRLGEYEVSGVIGIGGMGGVLKGYDRSLRRVVAIKVMAPHLADNGSARQRFQREARAAAAITHDNVIDIYGVAEAIGLPYLVMPYARGPSLQKRLDESGPMSVTEVLRIGRQIASGLAAAHEQGLVHRDIKPANILLNDGIERLWITDFGVARAMDDASMTQTGLIAGTPQYMSPEQARGETVDHRSDLFSLGSILYTAFAGRPPFRADTAYGILRRITDTTPRDVREINPDVPDWMCNVIGRLMAKHPGDRFQSAKEVADLLESCLAHLQQPTHVALPDNVRVAPARQSKSQLSFKSVRTGVFAMLSLIGVSFLVFQVTAAPDVQGTWEGDVWTSVKLEKGAAGDWYSGRVTDAEGRSGMLQLRWSRVQQRFNGQFQIGDEEFGDITFRRDRGKLSGAVSLARGASVDASTPRLREFVWTSPEASVTDAASGQQDSNMVKAKLRQELKVLAEANEKLRTQLSLQQQDRDALFAEALELRNQLNEDASGDGVGAKEQMIRKLEKELARLLGEMDPSQEAPAVGHRLRSVGLDLGKQLEAVYDEYRETRARLQEQEAKILASQAKADSSARQLLEQRAFLERAIAMERKAYAELNESHTDAQTRLEIFQTELQTALKVLESRLQLAEEVAALSEKQFRSAQKQFEIGEATQAETLEAEKAVKQSESEIEQLKALMDHFNTVLNLVPKAADASANTEKLRAAELERKVRVLAANLREAAFKLQYAEQDYSRKQLLQEEGLLPQGQLDRAKAVVASASAELERLQAEQVFLDQISSSEGKETSGSTPDETN